MSWATDLQRNYKDAKKWFESNKTHIEDIGTEGKKLYGLISGIIDGGKTVTTPPVLTKWKDVNEILEQAAGVQAVIDKKTYSGFFDDFMAAVEIIIKVAALGVALL
jgi:hypothetical protein